jgi:hypothetical protein
VSGGVLRRLTALLDGDATWNDATLAQLSSHRRRRMATRILPPYNLVFYELIFAAQVSVVLLDSIQPAIEAIWGETRDPESRTG